MRKTDRSEYLRDLSRAISRCSKVGKAVGLLVVQVEELDKVEGAFGYEISNKLLEEFCGRLEGVLRDQDHLLMVGDIARVEDDAFFTIGLVNPAHHLNFVPVFLLVFETYHDPVGVVVG